MMPTSISASSSAKTGDFGGGDFRGGGGNARNYNFGGGGGPSWGVIAASVGGLVAVGLIVWAILRKGNK